MSLTGSHFIGSERVSSEQTFSAINPETGENLNPPFSQGSEKDADKAASLASAAFLSYRNLSDVKRAEFLETIAEEIMALGDTLLERAGLETALPRARLEGERGRTCGQLKAFAQLLRDGTWVDAVIDRADPTRQPLPKPDTRSMERAIGPVVVFGASNFPLAFSVAGGDTASALAAGCPVIVKGHPAHPGTSELVASAINKATQRCCLEQGVFSLIQGSTNQIGESLVRHSKVKAVGFTGSLRAGRALFNVATSRPEPIPFYGELGSVNPLFILEDADLSDSKDFAEKYVQSLTMGVGQFCTKPGIVIAKKRPEIQAVLEHVSALLSESNQGTLLTKNIQDALYQSLVKYGKEASLKLIAEGQSADSYCGAKSAVYSVEAKDFMIYPQLHEEVFGPVGLVVLCDNDDEMLGVAQSLKGQLTATIHTAETGEGNIELLKALTDVLSNIAGRVLFNGFPTGVEVAQSMIHGGAYPATTDSRSTSVGMQAIYRFTRPVCYQQAPQSMLPEALKDTNPLSIYRIIDGKLTKDSIVCEQSTL